MDDECSAQASLPTQAQCRHKGSAETSRHHAVTGQRQIQDINGRRRACSRAQTRSMLGRRFGHVKRKCSASGTLPEGTQTKWTKRDDAEKKAEKQTQEASTQTEQLIDTPTKASSVATPDSFCFSDDDQVAETPPNHIPNYALKEIKFRALSARNTTRTTRS